MRNAAIVTGLAATLAGCSFIPKYERPAAPVSKQFTGADGARAGGVPTADLGWREVFPNVELQRLVALALTNNRDLRIAALNVDLARARYRIQKSELYPTIGIQGAASVQGVNADYVYSYTAGVGITSYELDLFGRVRSLKAAALEDYFATEQAQRATHLALVGEVASQFLQLRALDEQRVIAEQTFAAVQSSFEVVRTLAEGGQRSDLDVRTAEAQVHTARAEIIRLGRERVQAQNALELLVGAPLTAGVETGVAVGQGTTTTDASATNTASQATADATATAGTAPTDDQVVADLPSGLPLELLERRPDILAAEHQLKSANAAIGAARAAYFPTLSISALLGFGKNLFSAAPGIAWSLGGNVVQPLFAGGRIDANYDASKIQKRIEVARYEQAIQTAFREVSDALVARTTLEEQLAAQTARATAEQKRFEISDARYKSGIESYLTVLQAQQDLYGSQQQLVAIRLARLQNLVALYRALGGGWLETSNSTSE